MSFFANYESATFSPIQNYEITVESRETELEGTSEICSVYQEFHLLRECVLVVLYVTSDSCYISKSCNTVMVLFSNKCGVKSGKELTKTKLPYPYICIFIWT